MEPNEREYGLAARASLPQSGVWRRTGRHCSRGRSRVRGDRRAVAGLERTRRCRRRAAAGPHTGVLRAGPDRGSANKDPAAVGPPGPAAHVVVAGSDGRLQEAADRETDVALAWTVRHLQREGRFRAAHGAAEPIPPPQRRGRLRDARPGNLQRSGHHGVARLQHQSQRSAERELLTGTHGAVQAHGGGHDDHYSWGLRILKDVWLNNLPLFHVGGISILARASLAGQKVVDRSLAEWSPEQFHQWCENEKVTLTSLVPTQLFDLCELGVRAPDRLRAIIVGGGATDEVLFRRARALGFKCLPSYGMTECCSQVATATLESLSNDDYPEMRALPHVELQIDDDQNLAVQTPALFTMRVDCYADHFEPIWRAGDWYFTKDRAQVYQTAEGVTWLKPLGRIDDEVKISGELVNLNELNILFRRISGLSESCVLAQNNVRRGSDIVVALPSEAFEASKKWIEKFNAEVMPIAKIQSSYFLEKIPRTELGKVRVAELKQQLGLK